MSSLKDEKTNKRSKPTRKLKHTNSFLEYFEYFWKNIIKINPYNFDLYRFKVDAFFLETQCRLRSQCCCIRRRRCMLMPALYKSYSNTIRRIQRNWPWSPVPARVLDWRRIYPLLGRFILAPRCICSVTDADADKFTRNFIELKRCSRNTPTNCSRRFRTLQMGSNIVRRWRVAKRQGLARRSHVSLGKWMKVCSAGQYWIKLVTASVSSICSIFSCLLFLPAP